MSKIIFMKNTNEIVFVVSFFITLLMGVVSYLTYRQYIKKELAHLSEFWASLLFNVLLVFFLRDSMNAIAGFSMLGWIWPMRTFKLVMEDFSGRKISSGFYFIPLGIGGFVTLALAGYDFPFLYFSLPFSIATGGVGLWAIYEAYREIPKVKCTPLHSASFFLISLFFIRRLTFPFWRLNENLVEFSFFLEVMFLVGFAGTGLATYLEILKVRHDEELNRILKERSDKFLGQSKFSELGMMSAGIAHEINNPLAIIQARTSQLLRIYKNPEKQKEFGEGLEQVLNTSQRINRTIQGVREFVHQNENQPASELSLKDIFDDVLVFCGQRMKNHGVNLRLYGLENFSVNGHKIQLEQVILNILNNSFDAIEFLPDKWIEVSCHQRGDMVQLYFKDSGKGIPPDVASHMMEPFFSTKEIGRGTGLGLALAKGIVEKHGGTLRYLPDAPHTTFLLELPRAPVYEWGVPLH